MTRNYKKILIFITLAFMISAGLSIQTIYAAQQNNDIGPFSKGAKLWADTCSRCHNMRRPNEFRPDQWRVIMAHMRIRAQLTGQETREILMFLTRETKRKNSLVRNDAVSKPKKVKGGATHVATRKTQRVRVSGRAIYRKNCAVCHGANGKGVIQGAPDMTKPGGPLSKPYGVLLSNTEKGVRSMPPKGGNPALTRNDLKAALNYMIGAFKRKK